MSIADLANVPDTQEGLLTWSFAHMAHHRDIIHAIFIKDKIKLIEFPLDPMPLDNLGVWGYNHQAMHSQMDQVLNISPFDLTDVNWQDPTQRAEWIWLNFQEHLQATNILGI